MNDMSQTILPRSDQTNADDLIAGPRTITITRVTADPASAEQPVCVYFEGDAGKPWKPCKSMRRVMVAAWGADSKAYIGRQITLYCDPNVAFGGIKVGGIRISHMSHIDRDLTMALTVTRSKRAPYTVRRIEPQQAKTAPAPNASTDEIDDLMATGREVARRGMVDLGHWWKNELTGDQRKALGVAALDQLKALATPEDQDALDAPAPQPDPGPAVSVDKATITATQEAFRARLTKGPHMARRWYGSLNGEQRAIVEAMPEFAEIKGEAG